MRPTVRRGVRGVYGSWKTIWGFRREGRGAPGAPAGRPGEPPPARGPQAPPRAAPNYRAEHSAVEREVLAQVPDFEEWRHHAPTRWQAARWVVPAPAGRRFGSSTAHPASARGHRGGD